MAIRKVPSRSASARQSGREEKMEEEEEEEGAVVMEVVVGVEVVLGERV
jgi:hypothetical protein